MKTAILTVGTEILFGQIVNTNAAYLSQELQNLGYDVMYHYTVGDNEGRLKEMILDIFKDVDLIITTGGLGPTEDDLTKETIAEAMGDTLVENKEWTAYLVERFSRINKPLTKNNLKQAFLPSTSQILWNEQGTAPAFSLEKNGKMIIALPGPPREMKWVFENKVKPLLAEKQDSVIYYRLLRTFEYGESQMETDLLPLIDEQTDPTLATYAKEGECSLRIASKRATIDEAKTAVDNMILKVDRIIGNHVYSYDNEDLKDVVGNLLIKKNITLSACESATGGMFTNDLLSVPGISKVFDRGLVTYTEKAKIDELGVNPETIKKYSVVSNEVAYEMAQGLKNKTGSDIAISVTGYAGPDGGTSDDPIGTCYIGLSTNEGTFTIRSYKKSVNREWNRHYMVLKMLYEVFKLIR